MRGGHGGPPLSPSLPGAALPPPQGMSVMRNVRTWFVVSRSMVVGLAALVWGGCGVGPEEEGTGSEPQVQQAALLPDQCAPVPANQTNYGGLVYHLYSSGKTWANAKAD